MRGLFVTGTDTGAGKTVLAGAIVAALGERGIAAQVLKPLITGTDERPDPIWPPDDVVLARASGARPEEVTLRRYGPAVSPHLAAELAGEQIDRARLIRELRTRADPGRPTIVEGAGGLLVPICPGYDMRALARDLELPVLIAARPGLGTINHTLLTLEAARRFGLAVVGVVLTPWPTAPDEVERSNRATVAELGGVQVSVLPRISAPEPDLLAAAGRELPLDEWLEQGSISARPAARARARSAVRAGAGLSAGR